MIRFAPDKGERALTWERAQGRAALAGQGGLYTVDLRPVENRHGDLIGWEVWRERKDTRVPKSGRITGDDRIRDEDPLKRARIRRARQERAFAAVVKSDFYVAPRSLESRVHYRKVGE